MMIRRNKAFIEDGVGTDLLLSCIKEHRTHIERLDKLDRYYRGEHDILKRTVNGGGAPNNRLVCNFPKHAVDVGTGYMFGNPITYSSDDDNNIDALKDLLKIAESNTHDAELGKDLAVFGVGFELVYISGEDAPTLKLALIDPRSAFVVYDDTVEKNPLFGVSYRQTVDRKGDNDGYQITVYTDSAILCYRTESLEETPTLTDNHPNVFGMITLTRFLNNEEGLGDFENVISLVDAYNTLQSDRVNDKERFVNSILLVKDGMFETDEHGNVTKEALEMLKNGILILPAEADASYLTKVLNETETEVLRKSIADDIYGFSQIPNFADEQFAGNKSGVALAYKLLSLEYSAKVKERFFISGLRRRIKLFERFMSIKGKAPVNADAVEITFNRNLPVNNLELAQIISLLNGKVSLETMLAQLPFVKDIKTELERLKNEKTDNLELENKSITAGGYY